MGLRAELLLSDQLAIFSDHICLVVTPQPNSTLDQAAAFCWTSVFEMVIAGPYSYLNQCGKKIVF